MKKYMYLIVGGGMTAVAAIEGIRANDPKGAIGVVTDEKYPPYKRPPLTKGLWLGKPFEKIWFNLEKYGVDIFVSKKMVMLDPSAKVALDNSGEIYSYEKLLLATGGSPKKLRLTNPHPEIIYYRTLADYEQLRLLSETSQSIGVIGGGFIGSEIAAVMRQTGKDVTMIFPENSINVNIFPKDLSSYITQYYISKGVRVISGSFVKDIEVEGAKISLATNNSETVMMDAVVAGIGLEPNTDLADIAHLKVDNGIIVDEYLQTSDPDIYAAGDVANFYSLQLGKRVRVEHEDNALSMGKVAGNNMSGQKLAYTHLPAFYSDMFDLGYEAVGELSSALQVESV
ncbi:MAG: NAD(P)/FAD-dependent oxidoreductase, partial [Anaerolineae bacterium]|nr:NAD(P)/FAD-dependent oxidoreductase [Anaerolineae bacterium]